MSRRLTGAAGMASFALLIIGGLVQPLWSIPATGSSSQHISHYVAAHRLAFLTALYTYALGIGMLLWFITGVAVEAFQADHRARTAASLFGVGGVAFTTLILTGFVPMLVLAYRSPTVEGGRLLYDLSFALLAVSGIPTAVSLAAYGYLALILRLASPTSGVVAVISAVAHLAIAATFFFRQGFMSLEGLDIVVIPATLFAWVLTASAPLLRHTAGAIAQDRLRAR